MFFFLKGILFGIMVNSFKLTNLTFKAGPFPKTVGEPITLAPITILVGPNNSGKSQTLRDIENICLNSQTPTVVIEDLKFDTTLEKGEILELLNPFTRSIEYRGQRKLYNFTRHPLRSDEGGGGYQIYEDQLDDYIRGDKESLKKLISLHHTIKLDGATRYSLLNPMRKYHNPDIRGSYLEELFYEVELRRRVQGYIFEEFGYYFVIDPTKENYEIRMSKEKPENDIEYHVGSKGHDFFQRTLPITSFGDGVKGYVGIVAPLMSLPHRIILIEDPELFLHPPLARKLGKVMTDIALEREGSLIIATHNADIVIGCLESTSNVNIIRLTFENNQATSRVLQPEEVRELMNEPLTRSIGAINGLFHKATIVCESDADRVFYEEINRRLLNEEVRAEDKRHIDDALFLNALGKDSVHRIIGHLRKIGVPAISIVDFDAIQGDAFKNILRSCGIPEELRTDIFKLRDDLVRRICAQVPDHPNVNKYLKENGISGLTEEDEEFAESFLGRLAEYGFFIVPNGELESWLEGKGLTRRSTSAEWVKELFNRSIEDADILKPEEGDVWEFIHQISKWVKDGGYPTR